MWRLILALAMILPALAAPVQAKQERGANREAGADRSTKDLAGPTLYPGNGSYFLLVEDFTGSNNGVDWPEARVAAAKRQFKGRQGRLAVIDSPELYEWILATFDLGQYAHEGRTWIGLRYWCRFRQLTLANGEVYPDTGFTAWDRPWSRPGGQTCTSNAKLPYMSVYIEGTTGRWRATGYRKRFPFYLVEFPAPEGSTEKKASSERQDTGNGAH
ncbi:MAG: hypothetical protein D6807_05655 [Alphaproteobacteria bacterium]|nr:MAG: hypothetical protein D6807_05655 [Alphaproteobacteria bacterium]